MITQSNNFLCVYCNNNHPIYMNSDEHIIPRFLKNRNYVLKNVCRKFNNYMALSFENEIKGNDFIEELSLIVDPPKTENHRGQVHTNLDKDIVRIILLNGIEEFSEPTKSTTTNSVLVPVKDKFGKMHEVELTLPFDLMESMTVIDRMISVKEKKVIKSQIKLTDFLTKLANDPSICPPFAQLLKDNEYTFSFSKVKISETSIHNTNNEMVYAQQHYPVNLESFSKFYMKIAWTHGVKQLGREKMSGIIGEWILNYITTGHLIETDLYERYPNLFRKPVTIEGDSYIFWAFDIEQTESLIIDYIEEPKLYGAFLNLNEIRRRNLLIAQGLALFKIDDFNYTDLVSRKDIIRNHTLGFANMSFKGTESTVCVINLFGGLLSAIVRISNEILVDTYPDDIVIKF